MHLHPLLKQPKANKKTHPKTPSICIVVYVIYTYMYIKIIISFQLGTNRATRFNLHSKCHINVCIVYSQILVCTLNVIHTSGSSPVHTDDTIDVRSASDPSPPNLDSGDISDARVCGALSVKLKSGLALALNCLL